MSVVKHNGTIEQHPEFSRLLVRVHHWMDKTQQDMIDFVLKIGDHDLDEKILNRLSIQDLIELTIITDMQHNTPKDQPELYPSH